MVADGLTKGSADRAPLASIMDGIYELQHAVHEYKEPSTTTPTMTSSTNDKRVHFVQDAGFYEPAVQTTAA